jgi:hypothetical protein
MKARLIKLNDYYYLRESYKTGIGGAVCERTLGTTNSQGELGKLSKKNCDEIFGVVDVEKLAKEKYPNVDNEDYEYDSEWQMLADEYKQKGFIQGAKEILELNKDKVFTLEDMLKAYEKGASFGTTKLGNTHYFDELTQSLQQPTELEVDILMQCIDPNCDSLNRKGCCIPSNKPKLDENGCMILKKEMLK